MHRSKGLLKPAALDAWLLLLAAAAGWLDAATYLRTHIFVANMTGNTVLLGLGIGHHPPGTIVKPVVAIAFFVFGAFVGAGLVEGGSDRIRAADRALALETALLVAFALLWSFVSPTPVAQLAMLAVGACAMGLQQTATNRLHPASPISTTYQGGTVERLGSGVHEALAGNPRTLARNAGIWFTYLASAVLVAFIGNANPRILGLVPFAAVLAVAVVLVTRVRSDRT